MTPPGQAAFEAFWDHDVPGARGWDGLYTVERKAWNRAAAAVVAATVECLQAENARLRAAIARVGHRDDCPAVERLQPDRVTMAASGPCSCWVADLGAALAAGDTAGIDAGARPGECPHCGNTCAWCDGGHCR